MKSLLIKDTTREEREKIVREGLSACGGSCEGCNACDIMGGGKAEDIYRPYIEGKMELSEINRTGNGGTVK